MGKQYGVVKLPIQLANHRTETLEIATFRKDLAYKDHRHPKGVIFGGPKEDAERRDFTVNGLYFDPKTQRILDTVDGIKDIKAKVIRTIGHADSRFQEDALRLLRAVRLATQLGFNLHAESATAIRKKTKLIKRISIERVRDEVTHMLTGPQPAKSIQMLSELDLLAYILPEIEALKQVRQSVLLQPEASVWIHTLRVLENLSQQRTDEVQRWGGAVCSTTLENPWQEEEARESLLRDMNEMEQLQPKKSANVLNYLESKSRPSPH